MRKVKGFIKAMYPIGDMFQNRLSVMKVRNSSTDLCEACGTGAENLAGGGRERTGERALSENYGPPV